MDEEHDPVFIHGRSLGYEVKSRNVLVEGTTDVELIQRAARWEKNVTGVDLLGNDLAIIPSGERDRGGVNGVIRQLIGFRFIASNCLLPNGRPKYRFIGLFDNDKAGILAIKDIRRIDTSILEYKDVFRIRPVMSLPKNLDPGTMQKTFDRENDFYKGLDWEMEDLLPSDFYDAFISEYPEAIKKIEKRGDKVHREFTNDGKALLHRYVKDNAMHSDLIGVIDLLKALRYYLLLR